MAKKKKKKQNKEIYCERCGNPLFYRKQRVCKYCGYRRFEEQEEQ